MTKLIRTFRSVALGSSEVAANPLRSILLIVSITIAIFTTHVVFSLALQTEHDLDRLVRLTQGTAGTYSIPVPSVISPQETDVMLEPLSDHYNVGVVAELGESTIQLASNGHKDLTEATDVPELLTAGLAVISPTLSEVFMLEFRDGNWPTTQFSQSAARPILISEDLAQALEHQYDLANVIGQKVTFIADETATSVVAGVLANSSFTTLVGSDIYVPVGSSLETTIAHYRLMVEQTEAQPATMYYANHEQSQTINDAFVSNVSGALRTHGIQDPDLTYSVVGGDEAFGKAQKTMSLVFRVIAVIVLVIGIMPVIVVSFSSIRARSREISLRQAMGMTGAQTLIFVLSEILILVGSGIISGAAIALMAAPELINRLMGESEIAYTNNALWTSATAALLTALVLGVLPARAAAKNDAMQLLN